MKFENCDVKDIEEYLTGQDTIQITLDNLFLKLNREISKPKLNLDNFFENSKSQLKPECVKIPKIRINRTQRQSLTVVNFFFLYIRVVYVTTLTYQIHKYIKLQISSLKSDAFTIIQSIVTFDVNYEIVRNL